jgi:hypothetical protein
LSAAASSWNAVALTWTDNSGSETGFEIQRSTDNITFASAGTTSANATSATVSGLDPSTTYYFRVRAYQDTVTSDFSNTASATTNAKRGKRVK